MEYINAKVEIMGNLENSMVLACMPDGINTEEIIKFCLTDIGKLKNGIHFLVVFDSKENAVFPQTPFAALYGDEEEPQKHIKAVYEYNKLNGYSVLSLYEKNKWESPVEEIRVPV